MINYSIIEKKIESMKVTYFTDMWDHVLLDLLDRGLITEDEANEAMYDTHLYYFLENAKEDKQLDVVYTTYTKSEEEKDYWRNAL